MNPGPDLSVHPELVEGRSFISKKEKRSFDRLRSIGGGALVRLFAALLLALVPGSVRAHDARPLAVTLTEQRGERYLARLAVPPSVAWDNQPVLEWPKQCGPVLVPGGSEMDSTMVSRLMHCPGGLRGQRLAVHYAIYNPSLATLFRLEAANGDVLTQLLPPEKLVWDVPLQPDLLAVAGDYLRLGIAHIWTGIDHLLFVAGLLVLAGSLRRVVLAITGFTLAHSITLALSALDIVRLPVAPVEAAIALSILFVAREIAAPHPDGLAARHPILVSSSFGLLHGFGFAAALRAVGLPRGELAAGLLSFNLGVEVGQLAFVLAALAAAWAVRRAMKQQHNLSFALYGQARAIAGYVLGIPAAFWFIQRMGPVIA